MSLPRVGSLAVIGLLMIPAGASAATGVLMKASIKGTQVRTFTLDGCQADSPPLVMRDQLDVRTTKPTGLEVLTKRSPGYVYVTSPPVVALAGTYSTGVVSGGCGGEDAGCGTRTFSRLTAVAAGTTNARGMFLQFDDVDGFPFFPECPGGGVAELTSQNGRFGFTIPRRELLGRRLIRKVLNKTVTERSPYRTLTIESKLVLTLRRVRFI